MNDAEACTSEEWSGGFSDRLRLRGPELQLQPRAEQDREHHAELAALSELHERLSGTIHISAIEHAAETVLWPDRYCCRALRRGWSCWRAAGDGLDALTIGQDMRMVFVGAPSYFEGRLKPLSPEDLTGHTCINLRLPTYGKICSWKFEKDSAK
jgi:hypothetical protein